MKAIEIQAAPGGMVILRVFINSKIIAPTVIQPALENWVRRDGKIFPVRFEAAPAYSFLQTGGEARVTFTIQVPAEVQSGDRLYGALTLPGAELYHFPLQLALDAGAGAVADHSLRLTLPPEEAGEEEEAGNSYLVSKSTIKLLAGLASLEVIPSKWLVAELILACCRAGYRQAVTEAGSARLARLARTRFYKNGVLIFRGTQFVQWIRLALTISSGIGTIAGGRKSESLLLQHWEEWLFNLVDQDIESPAFEHRPVELPDDQNQQQVLDAMGMDPEKWFAYFILGLGQFSPRVGALLDHLCEKAAPPPAPERSAPPAPEDVLDENGSLQR